MMQKITEKDIALFMLKLYKEEMFLLQKVAALEIKMKFGEGFVTFNRNRNLVTYKNVLAEFKNLTPDSIWDRHLKAWREMETGESATSIQTLYK